MTYSDRLLSLQLDSLEACRVKCDLRFCYKIIHGLVDLNSADFFSGLPLFLPVVLASNCKNSTRQSTHANFIVQTVLLMLGTLVIS